MTTLTIPMADTIGIDLPRIPPGVFRKIAYYVTGGGSIQATPADIARFPTAGHVPVDQSPELQAYADGIAQVADVEPGAGTTTAFVNATKKRIAAGRGGNLYCAISAVGRNIDALMTAGIPLAKISFWLADWNLSQAQAALRCGSQSVDVPGRGSVTIYVGAVQWASPSSNPLTLLPGTKTTLREANVDLSETMPGWFDYVPPKPPPVPAPAPVKMLAGITVDDALTVYRVISTDSGKTWTTHT